MPGLLVEGFIEKIEEHGHFRSASAKIPRTASEDQRSLLDNVGLMETL
jgi:hypothetical protein